MHTLLEYLETPAMVLHYKQDSWQWQSDGEVPLSPEVEKFVLARGQESLDILEKLYSEKKVENVYVSNCLFHTFAIFPGEFVE